MTVTDKRAYHKVITSSYDKRSQTYNNSEWHRALAKQLVDYKPPPKNGVVLDIGTGTGTVAFYAASIVGTKGKLIGVDISQGMISKANELLDESNSTNIEFLMADGEELTFTSNSFDTIYSASSFFWMADKAKALEHWFSLLKPGGTIGFHAWPEDSYVNGYISQKALKKYGIKLLLHNQTGTLDKCSRLLENAGYQNIDIKVVEDGNYTSLEDAKNSMFKEDHYAHGQYPNPLTNVSKEILDQAQDDFEHEMEKLNTKDGVWNNLTMYYVYGQKPRL